nr:hypothetical protein CFP56_13889 [Quercus suber]
MGSPSIMNESEKGSSVSIPSAPPQPPNPSSEIDHSYHWTATGFPVHMTNQPNPPPRPAANPDLKSHPESAVPWSTGLFNCCDDVNSWWHGNIERQKREAKKPPAVQGAMTR